MSSERSASVFELRPCQRCMVRHSGVCGHLSDSELAELNRIAHIREFSAGEEILSQGEPTQFFGTVQEGIIKLCALESDGAKHILGLLFPSDFVGRIYNRESPFSAEAATDLKLCTFSHDAFERLVREIPALGHALLEKTLNELDACHDWRVLLNRKNAKQRVASFLMMLARRSELMHCPRNAPLESPHFEVPLSRADIADFLGLTVETVSRQFTRLKVDGVIDVMNARQFRVLDPQTLEDLTGRHFGDDES